MMSDIGEAINSMRNAVARMSRDMGRDHRDAWLYGVLFGWEEALDEQADRHGWTEREVATLERLSAVISKYAGAESRPAAGTSDHRETILALIERVRAAEAEIAAIDAAQAEPLPEPPKDGAS